MEEPNRNAIDEAYFDRIAAKVPFLRELRASQEKYTDNLLANFIHLFQRFSALEKRTVRGIPTQERNAYLFSIIEISNLIDKMRLEEYCEREIKKVTQESPRAKEIKQCLELLNSLRRYRNIIADAYHVLEDVNTRSIIETFCYFFNDIAETNPRHSFAKSCKQFKQFSFKFKSKFHQVNGKPAVHHYMTAGGEAEENRKIIKLLNTIQDLLEKAREEFTQGHIDSAALYFIAAANCARDYQNYLCERIRIKKGYGEFGYMDLLRHYEFANEDPYAQVTYDLLIQLDKIRDDRGKVFAHACGKSKANFYPALDNRVSTQPRAIIYKSEIHTAINLYLSNKHPLPAPFVPRIADASPKGHTPTKIRENAESRARHSIFVIPKALKFDNNNLQGTKRERLEEKEHLPDDANPKKHVAGKPKRSK